LIEIIRLTEIDDIDQTQWNDLLRDSEINEIFLTYQWIKCWWNCFGLNKELFILIAREGGQVIGIAPLMLSSKGWGKLRYTVVEFLGTGESDYCDFIVAPDNKERVLQEFLAFFGTRTDSWDVISLRNVPEHSGTVSVLQKVLHNSPYNVRQAVTFSCPTMMIQEDPDFALQCTKKKSLKRHFNYFDRSGDLTFRTLQTRDEILAVLEDFFQQHIERRAIAGGLSKFHDKSAREFYRCLVTSLLSPGWVKFAVVTFNEIPIAYHFGFEYFGKFVWYKPTLNIDYINKSPGEVLIKYLVEDAIQRQMTEFDFTIGDEAFKQRFSNKIRRNMQIEIVQNKRVWVAANAVDNIKQSVKKKLPRVFSFLKKHLESSQRKESKRIIRDVLKRHGFLGTGVRVIQGLTKHWLIDVNTVFVCQKRIGYGPEQAPATDLLLHEGQISDSRSFMQGLSPLQQNEFVSRWLHRLRDGDKLYVGKLDNRSVQYAWVSFQKSIRIPGIDDDMGVADDTGFIYDCHIAENHRGQGLYTAALNQLTEQLKNTTAEQLLVCCNKADIASLKGIEGAGFDACVIYTRVRLFGISVVRKRKQADAVTAAMS